MRARVAKLLRRANPDKVPVQGADGKSRRRPSQPDRQVSAYRRAKRDYARAR